MPACTDASASISPSSTARLNVVPWKYFWPKYASHVSACASSWTSASGPCRFASARSSGERDRVVAAERDGEHACGDERREPLLDLPVRPLGVAGGDRQVAVVDDRERLDDVERRAQDETDG